MKTIKNLMKNNFKFILGIILGLVWSSGIVYATANGYLFDSDEVSYDNTSSGLASENVQSALDELYVESTSYQLFEERVSALENVTSGTCTIDTTYTNTTGSSSCSWKKIGRIVILIIDEVCPNASGFDRKILASGVPDGETIGAISTFGTNTISGGYRVSISGSNVQWHWTEGCSDSCVPASGQIVYIAAS